MFPDMTDALPGWDTKLKVTFRKKAIDDFAVVDTEISTANFRGTLLPMTQQRIRVKPEGQRRWKWWTLITRENLNLDDKVTDGAGREYRVMGKTDWSSAGFYEYDIEQGPYGS